MHAPYAPSTLSSPLLPHLIGTTLSAGGWKSSMRSNKLPHRVLTARECITLCMATFCSCNDVHVQCLECFLPLAGSSALGFVRHTADGEPLNCPAVANPCLQLYISVFAPGRLDTRSVVCAISLHMRYTFRRTSWVSCWSTWSSTTTRLCWEVFCEAEAGRHLVTFACSAQHVC